MSRLLLPQPECRAGAVTKARKDSTPEVTATTAGGLPYAGPDPAGMTLVLGLLGSARSTLHVDVDAARETLAKAIALLERHGTGGPEPVSLHPRSRGGLARWQVNRITAYVDANIGSSIRASDLAALVRSSASHFFHAFKASFAETPLAYVARRRMAFAQNLMLTTDEPLAQIALACGLCDQSHFTRVFRRVVGVSPHAWRREYACHPVPARSSPARYGRVVATAAHDASAAA
jgi:AraC-like DNA-binding protein